jgi:hypothetical protein
VAAHIARTGDPGGRFGWFDVEDDGAAASALLDAVRGWLAEQGCTTMTGPVPFDRAVDPDVGVLVEGFERPGVTGRQWHPPWLSRALEAAGLEPLEEHRTWRLDPGTASFRGHQRDLTPRSRAGNGETALVGAYADPRLVLAGEAGEITAVPDIAPTLRSAGVRSAWRLARLAKARAWEACVVVRVDGEPAALVPDLCAAAADAGYRSVVSPWSPDAEARAETVHRVYGTSL